MQHNKDADIWEGEASFYDLQNQLSTAHLT